MMSKNNVFLLFQFPFIDFRSFFNFDESTRLQKPHWPLAKPEKEFVRSSGIIKIRHLGGVNEWSGEDLYANASRALRFPNLLGRFRIKWQFGDAYISKAQRRFYFNSRVARLEVGLRINLPCVFDKATNKDFETLLHNVSVLPVNIRDANREFQKVKLIEAGQVLSQHLLVSTTDLRKASNVALQPWWFSAGAPALIVEYPVDASFKFPVHTRQIINKIPDSEATLKHAWLKIEKEHLGVWFFSADEKNPDAIRRLRIHLCRFHAEVECLNIAINRILDGGFDQNCGQYTLNSVQDYLNDTIHDIQKSDRFGFPQLEFLEVARQAFDNASPGKSGSLDFMRRQVKEKVKFYINQSQKESAKVVNIFHGDVVYTTIKLGDHNTIQKLTVTTAKQIENSFNEVVNSNVKADLKEALKTVTIEIAKLVEKLPDEEADRVRNLIQSCHTF